jgi:signal transduction histidine kinase
VAVVNWFNTLLRKAFPGMLLICCGLTLHGQDRVADSLYRLLQNTGISPVERVDALNSLAYELYDVDDSAAFRTARQALELAAANHYPKGIKYAYTLIGLGYSSLGDYRQSIRHMRMADAVQAPGAQDISIYNLGLLGNVYRDLARYDSAQMYYDRALAAMGKDGNPVYKARIYKNIGNLHMILWNHREALRNLHLADSLMVAAHADPFQRSDVFGVLSRVYEDRLVYDSAEYYLNKMCDLAQPHNDTYHQIKCELYRASLAGRLGNFATSMQHCFRALAISENYKYPPQLVAIYIAIGEVYMQLNQYPMATKYFFEGLKLSERIGLELETARIYAELAWINKEQLNLELALQYTDRSEEIRTRIGDRHGISHSQNIRGLIFYLQKKYSQALEEFRKSQAIREVIGHEQGVAASLFNASLVYEAQGKLDKAYELRLKSVDADLKAGDKYNLSIDYNSLGGLLIAMNRLPEAERYINDGYRLARQTQSKMAVRNCLAVFAELYAKKGDYRKAYDYQKQAHLVADSVNSDDNRAKLAEMEAMYQIEQKEQQITLLKQEKQIRDDQIILQRAKIRQQFSFLIFATIALVLVASLAFATYRYNKQIRKAHVEIVEQKEEIRVQSDGLMRANETIARINKGLEQEIEDRTSALMQAYKELDTFFYRSSHDFRRPLTTFMGLAEVAKITVKERNALELFEKVKETAANLDKMLIKLQSISDVGAQQLIYKEVLLKEILADMADSFRYELDQRGVRLESDLHLTRPFVSYPAMVRIIIENLVENAIYFCGTHDPYVRVTAYEERDKVVIEVKDNGQGIDPQYYGRIFDMYFRGNERSKGNGLGLYIVRKAVEKLHGTVGLEAVPTGGSLFRVHLPVREELSIGLGH